MSDERNDGADAAFGAIGAGPAGDVYHQIGLTKREYMTAKCAPTCLAMLDGPTDFATVARNAVALADALLLELEKP